MFNFAHLDCRFWAEPNDYLVLRAEAGLMLPPSKHETRRSTVKTFYAILANALAASLTNTFVWFALTFWVYLETQSVIATSMMAGVYTVTVAVSGFFLGSLVDRYK